MKSIRKNIIKHRLRKSLSRSKQLLILMKEVAEELDNVYQAINPLDWHKKMKYGTARFGHNNFHSLKRSGYIVQIKQDARTLWSLTPAGVQKAKVILAKEIYHEQQRRKLWDGKWRFITFDIPEVQKSLRENFRGTLRYLGFKKLQASVYVFPYNAFDVLADLIPDIKKHQWIKLIEAECVINDKDLWDLFFK